MPEPTPNPPGMTGEIHLDQMPHDDQSMPESPRSQRRSLRLAQGVQRWRSKGRLSPQRYGVEGHGKQIIGSYHDMTMMVTSEGCFVFDDDGSRVSFAVWVERHPPKPLPRLPFKILARYTSMCAY